MAAYGGRCVDCGCTDVAELQLDHVNDNGAAHRRGLLADNRRSGAAFYRALKKLGFPNKDPYFIEVVCRGCHGQRTKQRLETLRVQRQEKLKAQRRERAKAARERLRCILENAAGWIEEENLMEPSGNIFEDLKCRRPVIESYLRQLLSAIYRDAAGKVYQGQHEDLIRRLASAITGTERGAA